MTGRTRKENGVSIPLTAEEETARDAEEQEWADGATTRNALKEIRELEGLETPRRLAESVLSDEGKAWLTANRDKIATERAKLTE
tara:strand:+ start:485 stop:739 length:255 start_codon:yes stop_codon:yes gene_type:complete